MPLFACDGNTLLFTVPGNGNLYTNTVLGVSVRLCVCLSVRPYAICAQFFFFWTPHAPNFFLPPPKATPPEGQGNVADGGCFESNFLIPVFFSRTFQTALGFFAVVQFAEGQFTVKKKKNLT